MAPTLAALLRRAAPDGFSAADDALLRNYVERRDRAAFAALVHRHGPVVYRACRHLLDTSDAEDAFQATFLVLARRAGAVRKAGSVGSWLVGVAGRVAREVRRARRRRTNREASLAADVVAPPVPGPGSLESTEHLRALHEELARLPDRLRGPVVACLLQGRTSDEAAAELGSSPRTVRRRVEQAKRVLRARLERRGVAPGVATGVASAAGVGTAAVPAELARRTVAVLDDALAGGSSPPVVLAQGVMKAMTPRKVLSLVAAAAACLTALGVGAAGSDPSTTPSVPTTVPPVAKGSAPEPALGPPTRVRLSAGVVRAVTGEVEYLRTELSAAMTGVAKPSTWKLSVVGMAPGEPDTPPSAHEIRVLYRPAGTRAANVELGFQGGQMTRAWVDISGPLDEVLDRLLAPVVARVVLAEHLGRPLPWWVDRAVAIFDPRYTRAFDTQCRAGRAAGTCLRLSSLFALAEAPRDAGMASAQAGSVFRFLLTRAPVRNETPGGRHEHLFFRFLRVGSHAGWEEAARAVGFENGAGLEAAWLRWVDSPESAFPQTASAEAPRPAPPVAPQTIPPTRVRDQ